MKEESIFEVLGYFEDVYRKADGLFLGSRNVEEQPGREMGQAGRRSDTITDTTILNKGHKTVIIRASEETPILCETVLQRLCGRLRRDIHEKNKTQ